MPKRKLIVSMNMTLDGFMAGPADELDWHFRSWGPDIGEALELELARADTIILGRVTYSAMADYWPRKAFCLSFPRNDIAYANMMNNYKKIVFSKTIDNPGWKNTVVISGNISTEIVKLKSADGKNMIVYGSGELVSALMKEKLVDEYILWIHPVILGNGKKLFDEMDDQLHLKLTQTQTFGSGVVALHYEVVHPQNQLTLKSLNHMDKANFKNIDDYISRFPKDVQQALEEIRNTIHKAAPDAEEAISYQIPTFKLNGNLVHFAAWKNHIGFYPTPSGTKEFQKELSKYDGAKGSVQFPLDKPMPLSLITKIVKFRVKEHEAKQKAKGRKQSV